MSVDTQSSPFAAKGGITRTGADRLFQDAAPLIKGKRIGILTNHTGRLSTGQPLPDAIIESGLAQVVALFGPEHGILGNTPDGNKITDGVHPRYNIPVYSLYGEHHKPSPFMLEGIDRIVCDIQDVGARFYTFISTVALAMEAAAEQGIGFVLLDRPNPIRGLSYDGPVREGPLKSFVAWMPIPVTHGMTIGELARLWNEEGWLSNGCRAALEVVPMEGWERSQWFDETGLPWVPPSPNIPRLSTAVIYPGICFLEGSSISEGRGTLSPFEWIGAPWADPDALLEYLHAHAQDGVEFSSVEYVPEEIPGMSRQPKYLGERCRGLRISITDRDRVKPVPLGIALLCAFRRIHPGRLVLNGRRFDILTGHRSVRMLIEAGAPPEEICAGWEDGVQAFGSIRARHLLYH